MLVVKLLLMVECFMKRALSIALITFLLGVSVEGINARQWVIDPQGDDVGGGTAEDPFRTISRGAEKAQPGDVVLVRAGIYRERVAPPRSGIE